VSGTIVSIDWSEVREGKLEELRPAMGRLVGFVEANESRPLAYEVFFSGDGARMTVVQIHPDSASMEHHMRIAASRFSEVKDLLSLSAIDIYGAPSEALVEQMREKARLLGGATVTVHALHAGFSRFSVDRP